MTPVTGHFEATLLKRHCNIKLSSFTSQKPCFGLTDGNAGQQGWKRGDCVIIVILGIIVAQKLWCGLMKEGLAALWVGDEKGEQRIL